jgi:hypothetical protein
MIGALIVVFGGFAVLKVVSGSASIGDRGSVSDLGFIVWFGPILVIGLLLLVGPRGPASRLYRARILVSLDADGIAWWVEGQPGSPNRAAWSSIVAVREAFSVRFDDADCRLVDPSGNTIAWLPGLLVRVDPPDHRSRPTSYKTLWLPSLVIAMRPDRYRRRRRPTTQAVLRTHP